MQTPGPGQPRGGGEAKKGVQVGGGDRLPLPRGVPGSRLADTWLCAPLPSRATVGPNPSGLRGWGGGHSLPIVIAHPQLKDPLGAELLQPLVHVLAHGIEVLIGLVPKTKHLCGQRGGSEAGSGSGVGFPRAGHTACTLGPPRLPDARHGEVGHLGPRKWLGFGDLQPVSLTPG